VVGDIYLMYGNHDLNVIDYLKRVIDPAFWSLIRNPFDLITVGLEERVHVIDQPLRVGGGFDGIDVGSVEYESPYLVDLSDLHICSTDVVVSHMNFTGAYPGQAMQKLLKWLYEKGWARAFDMDNGNNTVFIQAHTHKLSKVVLPGGMGLGFESGTMAHPMMFEYSVAYKNSFSPPHFGMVVLPLDGLHGVIMDSADFYTPFTVDYNFSLDYYSDGLGNPFSVNLDA
jgi:hypothetical protein